MATEDSMIPGGDKSQGLGVCVPWTETEMLVGGAATIYSFVRSRVPELEEVPSAESLWRKPVAQMSRREKVWAAMYRTAIMKKNGREIRRVYESRMRSGEFRDLRHLAKSSSFIQGR